MKFEWHKSDRYVSNGGTGPFIARILCATDKTVTIEWRRIDASGALAIPV